MACYESSGDRNVTPPLARLGAAEVEADGRAVAAGVGGGEAWGGGAVGEENGAWGAGEAAEEPPDGGGEGDEGGGDEEAEVALGCGSGGGCDGCGRGRGRESGEGVLDVHGHEDGAGVGGVELDGAAGGVGDEAVERERMRAVGGGGGEEDERAVRGVEWREDEGGGAGAVVTVEGGLGIPCGGEVREGGDGEPEER
jgi:hypothetical protein